jgi:hypothetical protein
MISRGIKMKRWLLLSITAISLLMPYLVYGFEFMYIDSSGHRWFSCGAARRGGYVKVKKVSKHQYRIFSKTINGIITFSPSTSEKAWCGGYQGVARMACGMCPTPDYDPTQTEKSE